MTFSPGRHRMERYQQVGRVLSVHRIVDGISINFNEICRLSQEHLATQDGQLFQIPTCSGQQVELAIEGLRSGGRPLNEQVLLDVDAAEMFEATGQNFVLEFNQSTKFCKLIFNR